MTAKQGTNRVGATASLLGAVLKIITDILCFKISWLIPPLDSSKKFK
jgi:hypothetical protein